MNNLQWQAYSTFGDLLRFLRQRERMSQRDLAAAVGYSDAQINRLERGSRVPDPKMVAARFIPALHLKGESDIASRLIELATSMGRQSETASSVVQQVSSDWKQLFVPATNLIGRERDIADAQAMLRRPNVRLITLMGPPGVGKTRLAMEIAHAIEQKRLQPALDGSEDMVFEDGVCVVPFAPVIDVKQAAATIAQALGVQATQADLLPSIKVRLRDRQMLLILDNFEHLVDAATIIADILVAAPQIKFIVTSRIALNLSHEFVVKVCPLAMPDAMQLFATRAENLTTGLATTAEYENLVSDICRLLDGLPLAIELAVAKLRVFSPQVLRDQLNIDRLNILRDGPRDQPAHQRTLRDTIAWSYHLLSHGQQCLFRCLSKFVGGSSFSTIIAVAQYPTGDILSDLKVLIESSLVLHDASLGNEPRYGMLELIREYAAEQLVVHGEFGTVSQAHARCFLDLIKTNAPLTFQQAGSTIRSKEGAIGFDEWMIILKREHANLLAALRWSLGNGKSELHNAILGAELALWLYWYWFSFGPWREAADWLERAVMATENLAVPLLRARLLSILAYFIGAVRDPLQAENAAQEALRILIVSDDLQATAMTWKVLGMAQILRRRFTDAKQSLENQLAIGRSIDDRWHISVALYYLGEVALYERDYPHAAEICKQYEDAFVTDGLVLNLRGMSACCQGLFNEAEALCQQALAYTQKQVWNQGIASTWQNLADISLFRGDLWQAGERFFNSLRLFGEAGNQQRVAWCMTGLAAIMASLGDAIQATTLWSIADTIYLSLGSPNLALLHNEYRECLAASQSQLRSYELKIAVSTGQAMSFETAVEYALSIVIPTQHTTRLQLDKVTLRSDSQQ